MRNVEDLPTHEPMKRAHRVRRFRRGNEEHGSRSYLANKAKPWKTPNTMNGAAA